MQSLLSLLRLGVGGLLLDERAYREQRDSEAGLRRGFVLVLLVGLLVGAAALVGDLIEGLARPSTEATVEALYAGLRELPWFQRQAEEVPGFADGFEATLGDSVRNLSLLTGGGLAGGLTSLFLSPILGVLGWLLSGSVAHLIARALGGRAAFAQTLSTTALASGVSLLGLVQVVPFAQVAGTLLLGLIATYVAIKEAHGLSPWRTFWATLLGPILLLLLGVGLACAGFFLISSLAGAVSGA